MAKSEDCISFSFWCQIEVPFCVILCHVRHFCRSRPNFGLKHAYWPMAMPQVYNHYRGASCPRIHGIRNFMKFDLERT